MEGKHLKNLHTDLSPLTLAACITGRDYLDAIKILRGQGCELANKLNLSKIQEVNTNLEDKNIEEVTLNAYIEIGEYLAFVGGKENIINLLESIFYHVVELKKRSSPIQSN